MINNLSGKLAEHLALLFLRLKGYLLVEHNHITGRGTGAGEIDLIVKKAQTLVFVEVKKRSSLSTAAYSISPKQQNRIRRAAETYLATHPQYYNFDIRFDAILIASNLKILHIQNAF